MQGESMFASFRNDVAQYQDRQISREFHRSNRSLRTRQNVIVPRCQSTVWRSNCVAKCTMIQQLSRARHVSVRANMAGRFDILRHPKMQS
jgi:hypothetical protein